ncbi:MAG: tRNA lysidine(34) synthetase TilS [Planctomycetes bacterium]|nr:tRNA lysidine(34) synthetase TilS [Planctomycetota bacterium]MCB9918061.1 tRNA lysidine(34) synthetase TilS [Planctomycetota bacterium]
MPHGSSKSIDDELEARFARRLGRLPEAFRRGTRPLVVAFSHGADSTALLTLLHRWQRSEPTSRPPVEALTIDHGLRPASADEARRAAQFCEALGVPITILSVQPRRASETHARELRYDAFREHAARRNARAILLAHHAGDQRETVLHRILRGTGPLGLCGMPDRRRLDVGGRCALLRPLLREEPAALRTWLRQQGATWIEDPTNADPRHTIRNRLRLEVVPGLANTKRVDALITEARAFRRAVHRELGASGPHLDILDASTVRLGATPGSSPWAIEQAILLALEALELRRPTRPLLRRTVRLFEPTTTTGKRAQSTGHWTAIRERHAVVLRADAR